MGFNLCSSLTSQTKDGKEVKFLLVNNDCEITFRDETKARLQEISNSDNVKIIEISFGDEKEIVQQAKLENFFAIIVIASSDYNLRPLANAVDVSGGGIIILLPDTFGSNNNEPCDLIVPCALCGNISHRVSIKNFMEVVLRKDRSGVELKNIIV